MRNLRTCPFLWQTRPRSPVWTSGEPKTKREGPNGWWGETLLPCKEEFNKKKVVSFGLPITALKRAASMRDLSSLADKAIGPARASATAHAPDTGLATHFVRCHCHPSTRNRQMQKHASTVKHAKSLSQRSCFETAASIATRETQLSPPSVVVV